MLSSFDCGKAVSVGAKTVRPGLDFRSADRFVASSAFTKTVKFGDRRSVVIRSPLGTGLPPGAAGAAAAGAGVAAGAAGVWAMAAPARRETAAAVVSKR